jgi:hypothetical protein
VIYDHTKGYRLYLALTMALAKVRTLRVGRMFTREEQEAIAEDVVTKMKSGGDPWKLGEALPEAPQSPAGEGCGRRRANRQFRAGRPFVGYDGGGTIWHTTRKPLSACAKRCPVGMMSSKGK